MDTKDKKKRKHDENDNNINNNNSDNNKMIDTIDEEINILRESTDKEKKKAKKRQEQLETEEEENKNNTIMITNNNNKNNKNIEIVHDEDENIISNHKLTVNKLITATTTTIVHENGIGGGNIKTINDYASIRMSLCIVLYERLKTILQSIFNKNNESIPISPVADTSFPKCPIFTDDTFSTYLSTMSVLIKKLYSLNDYLQNDCKIMANYEIDRMVNVANKSGIIELQHIVKPWWNKKIFN